MSVRGTNAVRQRIRVAEGIELELSWCGITDVGHRREVNQDSLTMLPPIFAVADGMGGHAAGEIASAAVIRRLAERSVGSTCAQLDISEALSDAVEDIEAEVGETDLGTGTTVTGAAITEVNGAPSWRIFNVGDSRVYQSFRGILTQLTIDHSVVQHLVDTGAIAADEAESHPHANVITRAVGMGEQPEIDFSVAAIVPGQRILVCSDGLTKEVAAAEIRLLLAESETAEAAAHALLATALNAGGRDNVTVIVIEVHAVGDERDTVEVTPLPAHS